MAQAAIVQRISAGITCYWYHNTRLRTALEPLRGGRTVPAVILSIIVVAFRCFWCNRPQSWHSEALLSCMTWRWWSSRAFKLPNLLYLQSSCVQKIAGAGSTAPRTWWHLHAAPSKSNIHACGATKTHSCAIISLLVTVRNAGTHAGTHPVTNLVFCFDNHETQMS